jgi:oligosaccharide repeat unit polymerase
MTTAVTRPGQGLTAARPKPATRRRRPRGLELVGSLVVLGAVLGLSHGMPGRVVMPLVAMTVLGLGLFLYAVLVDGDLFSPATLISVVVLSFYVARPIYLVNAGLWGAGASVDLMAVDALADGYLIRSLRIAVLATLSLTAGYVTARIATGRGSSLRSFGRLRLRSVRARRYLIVSLGLSGLVFLVLLQRAGGPGSYLQALSKKSSFLQGSYWTTFLRLPLKACLFAWAAAIFSSPRPRLTAWQRWTIGGLAVAVTASDFLTGGRATLLIQTLLPVALLYHYLRRPIRLRSFALLALCGMTIFVGIRVVTRDSQFATGQQTGLTSQLKRSVLQFPSTTLGGTDAVPLDSLMTLMAHESDPPLGGTTYLAAANAPVPRAIFPWKSDGGGNTWFTRTYYPRFYYPDRIETSLSLYGEAYANWRLPGVVVVPALFGALVGWLYSRFRRRSSPRWILGYPAAIGTLTLMLRGDAYQTTSSLLAVVVVVVIAARLVRRVPPPRRPLPGTDPLATQGDPGQPIVTG